MIRCGGAYDFSIGPFSFVPFILLWAYWAPHNFCLIYFFLERGGGINVLLLIKIITEFTKSIFTFKTDLL